MDNFEFSIIIPTHNSELGINKSIESIINQTLDFERNTEIIIIDNNSEDDTKKITENYISKYPENIKYFQLGEIAIFDAKNNVVKNARGKFIGFLEPHDTLSSESLSKFLEFSNANNNLDVILLPILYKKHYLIPKDNLNVDLVKNPHYCQYLGLSTFFKKTSAKEISFLDVSNENISFFSEILINNPYLGICSDAQYFAQNIDEKIYPANNNPYYLKEYEKFIKYNFINLKEKCLDQFGEIPKFIQFSFINHLRWILSVKKTKEDIPLVELKEIIRCIDDETLLNSSLLSDELKTASFLLKYDSLDNDLMEKLNLNTVFIDIYDIIDNKLHILANMKNIKKDVDVLVNGKSIKTKKFSFDNKYDHILGHNIIKDCSFECEIPINTKEKFKLEFKQSDKNLHIDFSRPCNFSKKIGYAKTKQYLSILKEDYISIKSKTSLKWIKEEIKSSLNLIKSHDFEFIKAFPFRVAYMLSYPFLKNKKIWFFMDRPDEADDNGLALFKYAVKQDDDISKYFIISSKSKDYNEIKKIGNVISHKSLKHRFLGMFVTNIITSHPDNGIIYPFWGGYPYFAGLLKSNTIFLQHGITKDDVSGWLNKADMNLSLFVTSANQEYESIFKYSYNYDENTVQLLGFPRYDYLKSKKNAKQIVIMPSWRKDLNQKSKEYIKESEFFKTFNSLINNEKLIKIASQKGYEIIFKPHPNVYRFIDLFDKNEYVKIDYEKERYQKFFNNGSLMITDYSSVAFDFAYLHKPILYYHYSKDYHFDLENSYFDYETMGFGEVVDCEEKLVDLIIEYMENNCKIKEEYDRRINEFFHFNDKNNSKRVYDKIKEIKLKD